MPRKKKEVSKADKYQPAPMPKDEDIDAVLSQMRANREAVVEFEPNIDEWLKWK